MSPRARRGARLAFALAGVAAAAALVVVREGRHGEALSGRAARISTTTSGSSIAIAGATLEVAPQSAVSFGGGRDGALVVVLDRGTVTCEVAPRSKRAPFIVEAGATRVTVIGTRFSVHRVGGHATVSVEHGLVEVADTNMTELVRAGERYHPGEPVVREALSSDARTEPAAAARVTVPTAPPVAAPQTVAAPASVTSASSDAAVSPSRKRRLALAEPAAGRPHASSDEAPDEARPREEPAAPAETAPAVAAAPEVKPAEDVGARRHTVQVLYELAAQLEVRDPEAALRIYGELAAGPTESGGGWAASALFAAARLEAERGQAQRARELAETYLRRFPRGPNADDARTLLARAR